MANKTCLSDELMERTMNRALDSLVPEYAGKDKLIFYKTEEAMKILRISSLTTMQKIRDEGNITYYTIGKKHILYHKADLEAYLEKNKKSTF